MNEEQLIEFVNWLPSVVPEFKNATPDQIVQALNQMSESDEGQQMLSQLINTFQQAKQSADSQMFKKGGKLAAFVSKYGKGGEMCCKKKAILQGGMVNKVAEKMQDGGETPSLTRREAREQAAANRGFSRGQFQIAMANAKNALRGAGLRGRDLRQQARQMVAGEPEVIEESRPVFQGVERVNNGFESMLPGKASTLSSTGIIAREVDQPSFGDIFARARSAGAKEFLYNGKRYNTLYKEELPYPGVDPKYNFRTPYSAGWTDPDLAREGTGHYVTAPEYQKNGGELATNTSANTLSNFGLLPKAQDGLSIQPQVKPSGIRGLFWKPTYQPRVDEFGYEGDTEWTGERATYYKPNGDLIQILTKNYKPGNGATTTRTIKYPFTPMADTTTVVTNQYGDKEVKSSKFNSVFKKNFDK